MASNVDVIKILVLEDDENMQATICELIEEDLKDPRFLFSARGVSSAAEAVVVATKHLQKSEGSLVTKYDLIISDVRMAGEYDGLGALERIKLRLPELRCIVITGYTDTGQVRALNIEVDDYLCKPFTMAQLTSSILSVCRKKSFFERALSLLKPGNSLGALQLRLSQTRSTCFQFIWVGIQSKVYGVDRVHELWAIWDALFEIESDYYAHQAMSEGELEKLIKRYREFLSLAKEKLAAGVEWRATGSRPAFPSNTELKSLFSRISKLEVTLEEFHQSTFLAWEKITGSKSLVLLPSHDSQEAARVRGRIALFEKLWSVESDLSKT